MLPRNSFLVQFVSSMMLQINDQESPSIISYHHHLFFLPAQRLIFSVHISMNSKYFHILYLEMRGPIVILFTLINKAYLMLKEKFHII